MNLTKFIITFASLLNLAKSQECQSNEELEPWQVTRVETHSPALRPDGGNSSSILVTIENPNPTPAGTGSNGGATFDTSPANCTAQWLTTSESPYDISYDCTEATWKMEVLKANSTSASPTENFDLKFTLKGNGTEVLVGREHFEVWGNLEGTCGGSGVCNWYLKESNNPVLIQPTAVAS
ncbi:hypothetical protein F5B20DRAFT_118157 [Whalleya microplaca]|nr:hypothetical protein F5B20DRAFT_118157 [Whalleya microplaca]